MPKEIHIAFSPFGKNPTLQGSPDIDIVVPQRGSSRIGTSIEVSNLSELNLQKTGNNTYILRNILTSETIFSNAFIKMDDFEGRDMIRTNQGDFTLDEIQSHGNNAPFYKQARITAETLKK